MTRSPTVIRPSTISWAALKTKHIFLNEVHCNKSNQLRKNFNKVLFLYKTDFNQFILEALDFWETAQPLVTTQLTAPKKWVPMQIILQSSFSSRKTSLTQLTSLSSDVCSPSTQWPATSPSSKWFYSWSSWSPESWRSSFPAFGWLKQKHHFSNADASFASRPKNFTKSWRRTKKNTRGRKRTRHLIEQSDLQTRSTTREGAETKTNLGITKFWHFQKIFVSYPCVF